MLNHFSCVQLCVTLWTVAHKAPLSMGLSKQEYWSGLPCPPPRDLPNTGIEPASLKPPALAGRLYTTSVTWEAHNSTSVYLNKKIYLNQILTDIEGHIDNPLQYSRGPSVQFNSVTQSCLNLCDPMNRSMPGLPVHHQLPEFTQIHAHRVGDAIQPSHPLSSPSPPAPNPSQHQGLFQ